MVSCGSINLWSLADMVVRTCYTCISLKLTELIKFLNNCFIRIFCRSVTISKISYTCAICSLVFRGRKCCRPSFASVFNFEISIQYCDKEIEHKAVINKWDTLVFVVL